jgi:hypothetical protein
MASVQFNCLSKNSIGLQFRQLLTERRPFHQPHPLEEVWIGMKVQAQEPVLWSWLEGKGAKTIAFKS